MSEFKTPCGKVITLAKGEGICGCCGQTCPDESGQWAACFGGESGPNGPGTCPFYPGKKFEHDELGEYCFDCGAYMVPQEISIVDGHEIAVGEVTYCECPEGHRCGYATRVE